MELNDFIAAFAAEFEETPVEQFSATTNYKNLEEWDSLIALSIISMVDDEFEKRITGQDLRTCATIADLYNLIINA